MVDKLEVVHEWLNQTMGMTIVQATDEPNGKIVNADQVLEIAGQVLTAYSSTGWINLADQSDLPLAKQGNLYPQCLEIGWGDVVEACSKGNSEQNGILYFRAYRSEGLLSSAPDEGWSSNG